MPTVAKLAETPEPVPPEEPLKAQAKSFLESLDDASKIRSDGRVGAQVVKVLAAINESMARGGAPVNIG